MALREAAECAMVSSPRRTVRFSSIRPSNWSMHSSNSSSGDTDGGNNSLTLDDRDTWLCRSTMGACSSDEEDDDDNIDGDILDFDAKEHYQWSDNNDGQVNDDEDGDRGSNISTGTEHSLAEGNVATTQPPNSKLLSIKGFSNTEALKRRLPVRPHAHYALDPVAADYQHKNLKQEKETKHKKKENDEPALEHTIAVYEAQQSRDVPFRMSLSLAFFLLFFSTAALHSALFTFSVDLRTFLGLETLPFGVLLLVCWTIIGLVSFLGGWIGDLVFDRIKLLRRLVVLWVVAITAFHIASFPFSRQLSIICLALAFPCSFVAHGVLIPNTIALGAMDNLPTPDTILPRTCTSLQQQEMADFYGRHETDYEKEDNDNDSRPSQRASAADEEEGDDESDEEEATPSLTPEEKRHRFIAQSHTNKYFSYCFGFTLAGSAIVQLYYFLFVNMEIPLSLTTPMSTYQQITRGSFLCMLFMSFMLLVALIIFVFQSRHHTRYLDHQKTLPSPVISHSHGAEIEQQTRVTLQSPATDICSLSLWKKVIKLCNKAFLGYALILFSLMTVVGAVYAIIVVLTVSHPSLQLRLSAFLAILGGWVLTTVMSGHQVTNSKKKKLFRACRQLGLPPHELRIVLLTITYSSAAAFTSFLRAQLYTTLVVQICQTKLEVPGTELLVYPDALGAMISVVSIIVVAISRVKFLSKNCFETVSPVQRMSVAILLYLVSIFTSSIVELYRRREQRLGAVDDVASMQHNCGKIHSNIGFMWTMPHLLLLSTSDALFRVSLQEKLHGIMWASRWSGLVQGIISLAEMIGFAAALTLTSALSSWLFRPSTSDLALSFLLMTTIIAFLYALLKNVALKTGR